VTTETRREILRTAARGVAAAALGAVAATLGLRRGRRRSEGYCDHAGKCGSCPVTSDCHVVEAIGGGGRR
jgi:hypothetical protein